MTAATPLAGWSGEAYGLGIQSEIQLPRFAPGPSQDADVEVRQRVLKPLAASARVFAGGFRYTPRETRLAFPDTGVIAVRGGSVIEFEADPVEAAGGLRAAIVGPAMGVLLNQRGRMVLHGSAVHNGRTAVVIAGQSGAGKSTMAAALQLQGWVALADDLVAIDVSGPVAVTSAGFAERKLWPDSVLATGTDPGELHPAWPGQEKRLVPVDTGRPGDIPVAAVYLIGAGDSFVAEDVPAGSRIAELIRHSYVFELLALGEGPRHLEFAARLLRSCRLRRLDRPLDFALLAEAAAFLAEDVEALASG